MTPIRKQNVRSKANPGRDGQPRSTEPKGFRRPAAPKGAAQVDEQPILKTKATAAAFVRATTLATTAVADPQATPMVEGPLSPGAWGHAVGVVDARLRCALTGLQAPSAEHEAWDRHHVIPKGILEKENLQGWKWDRRNGLYLLQLVHRWFDDGTQREIPRNILPPVVWEMAAEIDEHLASLWATEFLLDRYPLLSDVDLADCKAHAIEQATRLGLVA